MNEVEKYLNEWLAMMDYTQSEIERSKVADTFTFDDMKRFGSALSDQENKELRDLLEKSVSKHNEVILELQSRIQEMEKAGLNATELIAYLKDQYGFNEEEQKAFDSIRKVFGYKGDF